MVDNTIIEMNSNFSFIYALIILTYGIEDLKQQQYLYIDPKYDYARNKFMCLENGKYFH